MSLLLPPGGASTLAPPPSKGNGMASGGMVPGPVEPQLKLRWDEAPDLGAVPGLPAPLLVIYGETKVGKTTLMAETFPLALWICKPGAMLPFFHFLGLSERCGVRPLARRNSVGGEWVAWAFEHHIHSLPEVPAVVPQAHALGFKALGVDDTSLAASAHDLHLRRPKGEGGMGITSFKRFDRMGAALADSMEQTRHSLLSVCLTAHVRHPEDVPSASGQRQIRKGGPKFPARNFTDDVVAEADVVAYMALDPTLPGHGAVLDLRNHDYRAGDRLNCLPLRAPANLRGPLVHCGYTLARYPGLEWQDAVMAHVAARLDRGDAWEAVHAEVSTECLAAGKAVPHIKWALRDGRGLHLARVHHRQSLYDDFFRPPVLTAVQAGPAALLAPPPAPIGKDEDDED